MKYYPSTNVHNVICKGSYIRLSLSNKRGYITWENQVMYINQAILVYYLRANAFSRNFNINQINGIFGHNNILSIHLVYFRNWTRIFIFALD